MSMAHLLAFQLAGASGWLGFAPLIFIFAIFYFLLIMPQQRRQKKWQPMLNDLKNGDKVVTSGGLRGTIVALRDDYIQPASASGQLAHRGDASLSGVSNHTRRQEQGGSKTFRLFEGRRYKQEIFRP